MEFLTYIYLFYSFVAMYFLFLFLLIYIQNRKQMFEFFKPKREMSLSIVIPCYNEEDSIEGTIRRLLESDYKCLEKVIVVDDCSTDNSYKIMKRVAEENKRVFVCQTPNPTGCAAGAKNFGAQFVDTELIGFTDADSFPDKKAISNMVGFFNDPKVGGVTSRVLVKNREAFISRLQAIEYKVIAFTRKLLGFVDGIYVTNGPLSIYPKKIFDEVGGFDVSNMTEDIEITWHIVKQGYKVEMVLGAIVYCVSPDTLKTWFKQRIRWNVGGLQTIVKYRKIWFKCGMLGAFILPFFALSWFLAIFGLFVLVYRVSRMILVRYLAASYSVAAQTVILSMQDINVSLNVLLFFGMATLVMSLSFTGLALIYSKEQEFKKHGLIGVLIYMFIYLLLYPIVLITSIYKYLRGYNQWR
jgi:cellulose synthase/poly-beta-1,6-N-acetylglucosamine synthase-like glycosyltransferase